MQGNRKGESVHIPYRTGRFFCVDSAWYFTTREGLTHGPFATKEKAIYSCQTYIHICQQVEDRLGQNTKYRQTRPTST